MYDHMRVQRKPTVTGAFTSSTLSSSTWDFTPPPTTAAPHTTMPAPAAESLSHSPTSVAPKAVTETEANVSSRVFRGHNFRRVAPVAGMSVSRSYDPAQQEADQEADKQRVQMRASEAPQSRLIQPVRGFNFRHVSPVRPDQGNLSDRPSDPIQRQVTTKETVAQATTQLIQPKLTIGQPNDQYEQEADRVAAQVMSMPDTVVQQPIQREAMLDEDEIQTKPLAASITSLIQQKTLLKEAEMQAKCEVCEQEKQIQRSSSDTVQAQPDLESRLNSSKGGGSPLPDEVRSFMEPRFGDDFSQVRVHTGSEAVQMNRELGAQAFTHGHHIYYGAGEAPAKDELTGHELTHVVQQGMEIGVIQRQDEEEQRQGSRESRTAAAVLIRLSALSEDEEARLQTMIGSTHVYRLIEQRNGIQRRFDREEHRGMGILRYTTPNVQMMDRLNREIDAELVRLGVADEQALLHLVGVELPDIVLERAKRVTDAMLQRNEDLAREEIVRYAEQVCSPDTAGLLAADEELGRRYQDMRSTQIDIEQATTYMSSVPAGIPTTPEEYGIPPEEESIMVVISRIDEYRERLENQEREFDEVRNNFGAQFPVLLALGYEPGSFSAAPIEQLVQLTARPLQDIIDNIAEVREAVREDDMKVWNMRDVLNISVVDLGIASNPVLLEAVEARIRQQQEDENFIQKVEAALAITTTLLAGLVGGPWGAAIVGTLWSGYFLSESVGEYMRESAAENVAMDPEVRDISINEPQLLWVVLDLVGLGLDIGSLVRLIRPFARAALQTRHLGEFAEAVRRIAPEAADRLISSLRQRLGRELIEEAATGTTALQVVTPQSRYTNVTQPALLAHYEQLATEKMPSIVADVLSRQRATPTRTRLQQLYNQFEGLRTSVSGRSLTVAERTQAMDILREARDLARADFGTLRDSVWRRLRADADLSALADEMVAAGDAELGQQSGRSHVRVRTRWDDGRQGFQALEIEHRLRLSDNPWRYNDPNNLIMTDSPQNQQFLEALRREGGIWPTGDEIESFVITHGLLDQTTVGPPRPR